MRFVCVHPRLTASRILGPQKIEYVTANGLTPGTSGVGGLLHLLFRLIMSDSAYGYQGLRIRQPYRLPLRKSRCCLLDGTRSRNPPAHPTHDRGKIYSKLARLSEGTSYVTNQQRVFDYFPALGKHVALSF